MRIYAATPGRRTLQIVSDLLTVAWVVVWILIGNVVYDVTASMAAPGRLIESSANDLGDSLDTAGNKIEEIPYVGDDVATPFNGARDAAGKIAEAGKDSAETAETLAFWLGLSVTLIPTLMWAAFYVPARYRFIRRATAGQRFVDANADLDLFALRALSSQPFDVLAKVSDDPAGAWRARDPEIVRRLGELELKGSGLRPPR